MAAAPGWALGLPARAAAAVTHARTHCQWPPWPHAPHAHATPRTGSAQMEHCSAGCAAACSASPLLEGQACSARAGARLWARPARASCGPAAAALADAPEEQKPSREPSRPHDVLLGMPGGTCRGRVADGVDCRGADGKVFSPGFESYAVKPGGN